MSYQWSIKIVVNNYHRKVLSNHKYKMIAIKIKKIVIDKIFLIKTLSKNHILNLNKKTVVCMIKIYNGQEKNKKNSFINE
jgi:hypothetical protein